MGKVRHLLSDVIVPRLSAGDVEVLLGESTPEQAPAWSKRIPPYEITSRQAHTIYEVCWVVEGQCVLWIAGRAIKLGINRACIVRPGESHQLRATADLQPFHTLWWRLTRRGVGLTEEVFAQRRYTRTASIASPDISLLPLVEAAVRELQIRRPHHLLFVRLALLEACAHIMRSLAEAETASTAAQAFGTAVVGSNSPPLVSQEQMANWHVQRLVQYIEAHHEVDLTLEHLAAVAGLSPSYLTALFRRHTGRTAMAYVANTRHREALSLLRNTELPIAEVARLVGYADPYYFSRTFKAREGYTPRQYRSLFRNAG